MKKMMMMGGLLGFGIGITTGLVKEISWPALFLRACVTALLSGLLFRWWARVWIGGLKDSLTQAAIAAKNGTTNGTTK
jgi:hypothetical protein